MLYSRFSFSFSLLAFFTMATEITQARMHTLAFADCLDFATKTIHMMVNDKKLSSGSLELNMAKLGLKPGDLRELMMVPGVHPRSTEAVALKFLLASLLDLDVPLTAEFGIDMKSLDKIFEKVDINLATELLIERIKVDRKLNNPSMKGGAKTAKENLESEEKTVRAAANIIWDGADTTAGTDADLDYPNAVKVDRDGSNITIFYKGTVMEGKVGQKPEEMTERHLLGPLTRTKEDDAKAAEAALEERMKRFTLRKEQGNVMVRDRIHAKKRSVEALFETDGLKWVEEYAARCYLEPMSAVCRGAVDDPDKLTKAGRNAGPFRQPQGDAEDKKEEPPKKRQRVLAN